MCGHTRWTTSILTLQTKRDVQDAKFKQKVSESHNYTFPLFSIHESKMKRTQQEHERNKQWSAKHAKTLQPQSNRGKNQKQSHQHWSSSFGTSQRAKQIVQEHDPRKGIQIQWIKEPRTSFICRRSTKQRGKETTEKIRCCWHAFVKASTFRRHTSKINQQSASGSNSRVAGIPRKTGRYEYRTKWPFHVKDVREQRGKMIIYIFCPHHNDKHQRVKHRFFLRKVHSNTT